MYVFVAFCWAYLDVLDLLYFMPTRIPADGPNMTLIDSCNVSGEQICGPFDTFATLL